MRDAVIHYREAPLPEGYRGRVACGARVFRQVTRPRVGPEITCLSCRRSIAYAQALDRAAARALRRDGRRP
jgi:hypothetical protein